MNSTSASFWLIPVFSFLLPFLVLIMLDFIGVAEGYLTACYLLGVVYDSLS
jgi:hypothetical protein